MWVDTKPQQIFSMGFIDLMLTMYLSQNWNKACLSRAKIEIKHVWAELKLKLSQNWNKACLSRAKIEIKHVWAELKLKWSQNWNKTCLSRARPTLFYTAIKAALEPLAASGKFRWKLDFWHFSFCQKLDFFRILDWCCEGEGLLPLHWKRALTWN